MRRYLTVLALTLVALTACTNAGDNLTPRTLPQGFLAVIVYFDRDGSHTATTNDTAFVGARVALVAPGGHDTLRVGTTDVTGQVFFDSLPVGSYRVTVDRHSLNDSIGLVSPDTQTVRLTNQVTSTIDSLHQGVVVRFGYNEVSLAQARAMTAGRRVLVRGRVAAPLQTYHDSSAFIFDTSGALRVTGARPRSGSAGNLVGDSVLVIGTTGQRSGQGVLQNGIFFTYANGPNLLPQIITVAEARTARAGTLDAVLIQIGTVKITDTLTVGPDFIVTVADPADLSSTVKIHLDQLLNPPTTPFALGRTGTFRGVLVPVGDGTWVVRPRSLAADVILN